MGGPPTTEADLALFRQGVYRILAGSFLPPTAERLTNVREGSRLLDVLGTTAFAFHPPWVAWRRELEALDPADEPLAAEYVRLFSAGVGGAACPPVESFYLADARTGEVGTLLADLRRTYDRFRLAPSGAVPDTIDHVSIELEVMASLCAREAAARDQGDRRHTAIFVEEERSFLHDHLGRWMSLLADRLRRSDPHPLYGALGELVAAYVHHDAELVGHLGAALTEVSP